MKEKIFRIFSSNIKIRVSGRNINNFIKRIIKNNIKIVKLTPRSHKEVDLIIDYNDLEEIDVIDIIPDNIVNTIIKNNNINNEETTKDKEIATLKDFIVYKKNFYIIEDKYENILVCRNLNTNIKKYINCYEDYTIMNKNPQRKRS